MENKLYVNLKEYAGSEFFENSLAQIFVLLNQRSKIPRVMINKLRKKPGKTADR